jgi:hypothetical protein
VDPGSPPFFFFFFRELTELLCAGCVHDLEHHLSSLLRRIVSFHPVLRAGVESALRRPAAARCAYIHVDRFAVCILDCWVISFNEDPLDELRLFHTKVSFDEFLQEEEERSLWEAAHTGQSTFSHASRSKNCYVVLSVFGRKNTC